MNRRPIKNANDDWWSDTSQLLIARSLADNPILGNDPINVWSHDRVSDSCILNTPILIAMGRTFPMHGRSIPPAPNHYPGDRMRHMHDKPVKSIDIGR